MRSSILRIRSSSLSVTKLTAIPPLPARAVRPTRCIYSSGSSGRSQLMTMATSSISRPRAPTSVEINTGTIEDRNNDNEESRSRCVSRECNAVLRIDSVLSSSVKYAAVRGRAQKMIVGGGCSGASSSTDWLRLDLFCFFVPVGPEGARRKWSVLSGGLQRKWKRYDSRT